MQESSTSAQLSSLLGLTFPSPANILNKNIASNLHSCEALSAILDGDARRAAAHPAYLRCGASCIATGCENRLFALEIIEHLFEQRNVNQSTTKNRDAGIRAP
jgi:hypothetical protein